MIVSPLGLRMKKCEIGAMLIVADTKNDRDMFLLLHQGSGASAGMHSSGECTERSLAMMHQEI
jgi:hypothetical protein